MYWVTNVKIDNITKQTERGHCVYFKREMHLCGEILEVLGIKDPTEICRKHWQQDQYPGKSMTPHRIDF